jgi:hypothetical protein
MTRRFAGLRERTQSFVHARRRYSAAKAGFGGGIKAFPDAGRVPRAMPRLPPDPADGVFAAIEVVLRCGRGAQARPETRPSRESINERIFRIYPRGEMELFCGALIHTDGKGIASPAAEREAATRE